MSKHVLFDLDGTLLDTAKDFTQVLNQLLQQYGRDEITHAKVKENRLRWRQGIDKTRL